jgi:hypothetical protein
VPSHRAETPTDALTTVRTRPSGHPAQPRRRDLRAHNRATSVQHRPAPPTGGPSWLDEGDLDRTVRGARLAAPSHGTLAERATARAALRTPHRGNPLGIPQPGPSEPPKTPTWGALALDPLFVVGSAALPGGWVLADPDSELADPDLADAELTDAEPLAGPGSELLEDDGALDGEPLLDQVW